MGHGIRFDFAARRIWCDDRELHLTRKAFDLLRVLIERRPDAVSKTDIHAQLWPDTFVSDVTLHSLMSDVRRILADNADRPRFIRTVHGFGYAFVGEIELPVGAAAARRQVRGWLVSQTGRVNLFEGDNLLGRGTDDVIDVPSPTVSRRHASIRFETDAWLVDLGSKNGTFLDDVPVTQPVRLTDGDRVRLGAVLLTFKLHPTKGATSTQPLSSRGRTSQSS